MNPLFVNLLCFIFFFFQIIHQVYAKVDLKSVTLSVDPPVYKANQSFILTCAIDISPLSAAYFVAYQQNNKVIARWAINNTKTEEWKSFTKYITQGDFIYPNFTARVGVAPNLTQGVYRCLLYTKSPDAAINSNEWNRNASFGLELPSIWYFFASFLIVNLIF